jgi:hypothetical protein
MPTVLASLSLATNYVLINKLLKKALREMPESRKLDRALYKSNNFS